MSFLHRIVEPHMRPMTDQLELLILNEQVYAYFEAGMSCFTWLGFVHSHLSARCIYYPSKGRP